MVRPRGWHLDEKHLLVDGQPLSGSLFDFGLYFFHNARRLLDNGPGRTSTCRSWRATSKPGSGTTCSAWRRTAGIPLGTIRATVLIETIPARSRWTRSSTSCASTLRAERRSLGLPVQLDQEVPPRGQEFALPDRASVTMTAPFMRAYTELLVKTCHRRGAHAIGGMAAFIPSRRDPEVNAVAHGEGAGGQDARGRRRLRRLLGSPPGPGAPCRKSSTHPGTRRTSQQAASGGHRVRSRPLTVGTTPGRSPKPACATTSASGCSTWRPGSAAGAVAIFNLMEDAATAESRGPRSGSGCTTTSGWTTASRLPPTWCERIIGEELATIRGSAGRPYDAPRYYQAVTLFSQVALADDYAEFLTLLVDEEMP